MGRRLRHTERGELARKHLDRLGVAWGPDTDSQFREAEGPLDPEDASEAIRAAAQELEQTVREATGTRAPYELSIEATHVDAYWSYWLDGAGRQVRLRLDLRNARFTHVRARQFALHEVLGHGLQSAGYSARCATDAVPWARLLPRPGRMRTFSTSSGRPPRRAGRAASPVPPRRVARPLGSLLYCTTT